MIRVKIIALGKLKEAYLRDAASEYEKRLRGYCTFELTELSPKALPENPNAAQIEKALSAEADMILKAVPRGSFTVALCIEGKGYSSEGLAEVLDRAAEYHGSITFIIGSSYGLSDEVKRVSDIKMSMSAMTFPHQLARVMLLEQIYRGFKINEGSAYHK